MNLVLIIRLLGVLIAGMLIGVQIKERRFNFDFYLNVVIICIWFYLILSGQ